MITRLHFGGAFLAGILFGAAGADLVGQRTEAPAAVVVARPAASATPATPERESPCQQMTAVGDGWVLWQAIVELQECVAHLDRKSSATP